MIHIREQLGIKSGGIPPCSINQEKSEENLATPEGHLNKQIIMEKIIANVTEAVMKKLRIEG